MKDLINWNRRPWLVGCVLMLSVSACDLDIEATDSIITEEGEGTFSGVGNPASSVNDLYNSVGGHLGAQDNFYALSEVSTDELLVPTRGTDWGDNGIWRTLHAHTWRPDHQYVLNAWNQMNQNVFRASEIIETSSSTPLDIANAKFVRAYSMYNVMDLYGQVPFRDVFSDPSDNPSVLTRQEAYDFILRDLNEALSDLPITSPGGETNRASRATANFLKAKLLLNAHIYNGTGTPSGADLQGVIDAVDEIEADGFALEDDFFSIFKDASDSEEIWWVVASVGSRIWNGLHYNQTSSENQGGGWNGFSTLAEFYDTFDGNPNSNFPEDAEDERRGFVPDAATADETNIGIGYGFLVGQQYGVTEWNGDGAPVSIGALNDRPGNPLVFTKELPGLVGNNERNGIRVIKYHPVDDSFRSHLIVFRFADAYLMRAEARLRNGDAGTALAEINALRVLREAAPLASLTEDELLDERGRELYAEWWRRNDMIRFGQFTRDWEFKDPGSVGDENRSLYPIPSDALLSNPNLVQNPGY
ncbi:MAG: RagB/SusD family nutrient uptake outer membrane protein [Cyclobacteriaceae bacterium]